MKHSARLICFVLCALLPLIFCTSAYAESGSEPEEKRSGNKADSVISYFDCNTEYKDSDNVYCVMVVTDDCEGAATDDDLFITLTGQNGASTIPINVNSRVNCDYIEYRTYYGYNKGLGRWERHADSCRDGSFNLYIIRTPENLTSKITEITLMTTPNTWFAEGSWSIHSVYAYKLVGKMAACEFSSSRGFQGLPEFDYSLSQYALLNSYTLDAASREDGWDKTSIQLSKLPTDARFIEETFSDLGYTGFPSTGSIRKSSYTITVFMLVCVGVTIVFSLCVMLYRHVFQKRNLPWFLAFLHPNPKPETERKRKYFR